MHNILIQNGLPFFIEEETCFDISLLDFVFKKKTGLIKSYFLRKVKFKISKFVPAAQSISMFCVCGRNQLIILLVTQCTIF